MKKKAFALIYALLLTFTLLMVLSAVTLALTSDIKLTQQSKSSTQAYDLARSGIADGFNQYKAYLETNGGLDTANGFVIPEHTAAATYAEWCNSGTLHWRFYYSNAAGTPYDYASDSDYPSVQDLFSSNPNADKLGFYAFRVCINGTTGEDVIESTGFYNGLKIGLRADLDHSASVAASPIDYKLDRIKIYQINH